MKKLIVFIYIFVSALCFGKIVEIEFKFDIDSGTIYYSNAGIDSIGNLATVNFDKKDVKLALRDGVYIFGFYDNKDRYLFKKLYITDDRDFKIQFMPQKTISVTGVIKEKKSSLDNVKITFTDSMGREYSAFSNKKGEYSVNLPPEKYTLTSSQFGYEITDKKTEFDFAEPNKSYNIPINFQKTSGKIKGKVLNDKNIPIPKAKVFISNNKKEKIVYTDFNGNFSTKVDEGITSMKITREGYVPTAFIGNFSRKDTINLQKFSLVKNIYFISGSVINDVLPIKNQEIYLFSENGSLLDKAVTNENGNFKFLNIQTERAYIYIPESEKYQEHKSDLIVLDKSISNKIITLESKY